MSAGKTMRAIITLGLMASAAVVAGGGNADAAIISASPATTFAVVPAAISIGSASYTFSAIVGALPGDPPAAVTTGGTAMVSSFFGGVSDFEAGATIDGTGLYTFSAFPNPATIPNSAADDFIGLAFTLSDGLHYGYAEVAGTELVSYGYQTTTGETITTGAVATPEPTTIAMLGVGLAGLGLLWRRRKPDQQ